MSITLTKPEHEVAYRDLIKLVNKNKNSVNSEELLAIASNMLGKLIALQDQRTMTNARAMEIVIANIELGNHQVLGTLANPKGSA